MQQMTSDNMADTLEPMWETHREFLRRLLIGLTRDIDLADDLLQESYLKARAGIDGYRGGEPRAWLAAIAKNAFNSHLRRRYVRFETALGEEDDHATGAADSHLDLIEIRRALADLPEAQRTALVMKHYGGYNYNEIAAHLECPTNTAKSRVSSALKRLRGAMAAGEEPVEMKCADLSERALLDHIYGRTPESEQKRIESHLAACASCRARAAEVGLVLRALDAAESDYRGTFISEIHDDGTTTDYLFLTFRNEECGPLETLDGSGDCADVRFATIGGEEVQVEQIASEPGQDMRKYKLHLPKPVPPGEQVELIMTGHPIAGHGAKPIGEGIWRFGPGKIMLTEPFVYVTAVRLPPGATFLTATPDPQEVCGNNATTVIWRGASPAHKETEFSVDYRLG